jgi:hypothetical protein
VGRQKIVFSYNICRNFSLAYSDIALVKNNALTGARIAVALSDLRKRATKRKLILVH